MIVIFLQIVFCARKLGMILVKVIGYLIKENGKIDGRGCRLVVSPIKIVRQAVILEANVLVDLFDLADRDWKIVIVVPTGLLCLL